MTILALVGLTIVHMLPWLFMRRRPLLESPAKLAALLSAIQILPQFGILMFFPERSLVFGRNAPNFNSLLAYFGALYICGMLAFYFGLGIGKRVANLVLPRNVRTYEIRRPLAVIAFLLIIYLALMYQVFDSAGGLIEYLSNIGARASMLAGSGIFFLFSSPASYMVIFLAIFSHANTGRPSLVWLLLLIVFLVGVESLLGGRRQPVQMLLFAALAFTVFLPGAKLFSFRNMMLGTVAIVIFIVLLVVRVDENQKIDAVEVIMNLSHIDPYLFVLQHFGSNDFWYGRSFLDIIDRVAPFYNLPSPSPIDEGVYVYNLFLGRPVIPPTPMAEMSWNSWPADTFGNGYMNFGVAGVLGFYFVRGVVVSAAYTMSRKSGHSPALLLVYLWLAFGFHVSNLKITQSLMLLAGIATFLPIVSFINRVSVGRSKFKSS